jgi:hypothetical protein
MNENLKKQLVKLGSTNPELRPHIREVLAKINSRMALETVLENAAYEAGKDFVDGLLNLIMKKLSRLGLSPKRHGDTLAITGGEPEVRRWRLKQRIHVGAYQRSTGQTYITAEVVQGRNTVFKMEVDQMDSQEKASDKIVQSAWPFISDFD